MMKKELIFEIKSICQNFRLIGAIYCNNIGSNRNNCKENGWLVTTLWLTLVLNSVKWAIRVTSMLTFLGKKRIFAQITQTMTEPCLANFRPTTFKTAPLDVEIFILSLLQTALEYSRWWCALTWMAPNYSD